MFDALPAVVETDGDYHEDEAHPLQRITKRKHTSPACWWSRDLAGRVAKNQVNAKVDPELDTFDAIGTPKISTISFKMYALFIN